MQLSMPEKETSRLYLRGMEEADACDIYDYYRQACVTQFLTFPPHPDVEHTLHILKAFYLPYERRGEPQAWCVLDKQRGKVMCVSMHWRMIRHSLLMSYIQSIGVMAI